MTRLLLVAAEDVVSGAGAERDMHPCAGTPIRGRDLWRRGRGYDLGA